MESSYLKGHMDQSQVTPHTGHGCPHTRFAVAGCALRGWRCCQHISCKRGGLKAHSFNAEKPISLPVALMADIEGKVWVEVRRAERIQH